MERTNPFQAKLESYNLSISIMEKWEDCEEHTKEYFGRWIEEVGGWDEWLSKGYLEETIESPWEDPVPQIQTRFGNFVYDPVYQKWLDDDGLNERIEDHESNS